jgi:hypothetical protein
LGQALLPLYVRWFCDKLVASLVPRLIGSIYRCRRIGESGAQQIQMDVGALKATTPLDLTPTLTLTLTLTLPLPLPLLLP